MSINPIGPIGQNFFTPETRRAQANSNEYISENQIRQWLKSHVVISSAVHQETTASDDIIDKLLRAFQKLNKCFPDGLKLIMSKSPEEFKIKICESSSSFNPFPKKIGDTSGETVPGGTTVSIAGDKIMIELYCDSELYKYGPINTLSHELFHAIEFLAVKDSGGDIKALSTDKEYLETLRRAGENYNKGRESAVQECRSLSGLGNNEKVESIRKIWEKYKTSWAALIYRNEELGGYKLCLPYMREPVDPAEVLAYGLQAYFNEGRKELLKKEAPELYRLIEEVIVPNIKGTARG